jgi:hypothetical protein
MQKIPVYLVPNRIKVIASLSGDRTEFRQVYQRTIKLYKGIDNRLEFQVKNSDQKPIDVATYTPTLILLDANQNLLLTKDGSTDSTIGTAYFTITAEELENIPHQYVKHTMFLTDQDNQRHLVYTDTQFTAPGTIEILSNAFAIPRDPTTITTFSSVYNTSVVVSEAAQLSGGINGASTTTTVVAYGTLSGEITVQATIDESSNDSSTIWTNVGTIDMTGSSIEYFNVTGAYTYLRFRYDTDEGTIDKILVRN